MAGFLTRLLILSGSLYGTGDFLPSGGLLFYCLLSPTLFILAIRTTALRRLSTCLPCRKHAISLLRENKWKSFSSTSILLQNTWPESTKCVSSPPIHFTNLLTNSLLLEINLADKGLRMKIHGNKTLIINGLADGHSWRPCPVSTRCQNAHKFNNWLLISTFI